jgi:hypothetical protein
MIFWTPVTSSRIMSAKNWQTGSKSSSLTIRFPKGIDLDRKKLAFRFSNWSAHRFISLSAYTFCNQP